MLEVEMKFPVADHQPLLDALRAWPVREEAVREDADHYFNAPDRDFAQTDEALRVRRIGAQNLVTYKGPKRDAQTKTRTEIEVPLAAGAAAAADFMRLLTLLGYRPVTVVRKKRHVLHLDREGFALEVCLDTVAEVGLFAELEILAPEEELDKARAVLLETAKILGLTTSERRSYLELLLARRGLIPA